MSGTSTKLVERDDWTLLSDPKHRCFFWCAGSCAQWSWDAHYHQFPRVCRGPIYYYRRWFAPWGPAVALQRALAWNAVSTQDQAELDEAIESAHRQQEIEKLVREL